MNSEIEVDASEVRVKKGKKGVILARRKNDFSTAKKMMSSVCVGNGGGGSCGVRSVFWRGVRSS